jgi:hypothetical protein
MLRYLISNRIVKNIRNYSQFKIPIKDLPIKDSDHDLDDNLDNDLLYLLPNKKSLNSENKENKENDNKNEYNDRED